MTKYKMEHDATWNVDSIFPASALTLDEYLNTTPSASYVEIINDLDLANRILDLLNSDTEDLEKTAPTNG